MYYVFDTCCIVLFFLKITFKFVAAFGFGIAWFALVIFPFKVIFWLGTLARLCGTRLTIIESFLRMVRGVITSLRRAWQALQASDNNILLYFSTLTNCLKE